MPFNLLVTFCFIYLNCKKIKFIYVSKSDCCLSRETFSRDKQEYFSKALLLELLSATINFYCGLLKENPRK